MKHSDPDLSYACPCGNLAVSTRKTIVPKYRCTFGHEFAEPILTINRAGISKHTCLKCPHREGLFVTYAAEKRLERLRARFGNAWVEKELGFPVLGRTQFVRLTS